MALEGSATKKIELYSVFMVNFIIIKIYKIMKIKIGHIIFWFLCLHMDVHCFVSNIKRCC